MATGPKEGPNAMTEITQNPALSLLSDAAGYDPIEDRLRASVRATIETMFEEELAEFLGRMRYGRSGGAAKGNRHGHRDRPLTGTFGTETLRVPRTLWRTKQAEALIAAVYLAGSNSGRVNGEGFSTRAVS